MRLKSYYAGTVEAALSLAGRELGPDALIVGSRPAPPEAGRPGEYEVTFAIAEDAVPPRKEKPVLQAAASHPAPGLGELQEELAEIRRSIESVSRSQAALARLGGNSEVGEFLSLLLDADLAPGTAQEVLDGARFRYGRTALAREKRPGLPGHMDRDRFLGALREELESRIQIDTTVGREGAGARVTALVGPAGAGKTTTLVKLAARFGMQARRPVQILSMDSHRIAAAEQLRCFAAILGVGFQVLDTPRAMSQAIEEHRGKEFILIDTPGLGAADAEIQQDLRRLFSSHPEIDVHLVLPATTKAADLAHATNRFLALGAAKLIFTRLDETASLGAVVNEALRSGLPVSFLCAGQQIPEDIQEAAPGLLLENILPARAAGAAVAA